ncbi:M23 family metallopeptidase [Aquimarina agarivorans]|uniref:M23 family metallopeptidase n=1 Tax=Aquimarina agarivorans TaxID=980584 RepID=UPI000248E709|nr:M23 family metallopeptidase [Aquimarina agarivorans]
MSKVKYYYDSETLSYRKIEPKKGRKLGIALLSLIGLFLASFVLLITYYSIPKIETPKEKKYRRELENMKLQYKMLNNKMDRQEKVLNEIADRDNTIYRLYFEAEPITEEQRKAGFGGVNRYNKFDGFENSELIKETNQRVDQIAKQIAIQSKSLDEVAVLAKEKEKLLAAIPAIQPIQNKDLKRMASGYGMRSDPFTKVRKMHRGMDFSSPRGTPIFATGDGVVTRADSRSSGYGNHIRIEHGYGYKTLYAHLYKYNVKKGQKVKRGDVIGFVGSTGRSQAPHLHYEVFKDGKRINPINFYYGNLSAQEFATLLQKSREVNQSLD